MRTIRKTSVCGVSTAIYQLTVVYAATSRTKNKAEECWPAFIRIRHRKNQIDAAGMQELLYSPNSRQTPGSNDFPVRRRFPVPDGFEGFGRDSELRFE